MRPEATLPRMTAAGTTRRPLPWALIMGSVLIAALLAGLVYCTGRLVRSVNAYQREHPGAFTVAACQYTPARKGYWMADCAGDFRSDDGTLSVDGVTVSFQRSSNIEIDPMAGARWRARLAGPDDHTADLSQDVVLMWGLPLTLDAVLLAWLIAQVVWLVRQFRRRSARTSRA
jgi:hypothetical protein